MQLVAPVLAWNRPAAQLVHTVAADAEYKPATQKLGQDGWPVSDRYLPAAHAVQAVNATRLAYLPAAHEEHAETALDWEYMPTEQATHAVDVVGPVIVMWFSIYVGLVP